MAEKTEVLAQRRMKFEGQLLKMGGHLGDLLPQRFGDPARFVRMCGTAVLRNPDLLAPDVDRASVVIALLAIAEMGLAPGPLAHVVLFRGPGGRKFATPIPDYKGLVDVALASGKVSSIRGACVYANDTFKYVEGQALPLVHEPLICKSGEERGEMIGAYSMAWPALAGLAPWVTFMQRYEIESVRNKSKGYVYAMGNKKESPWCPLPGVASTFRPGSADAEMAVKTTVRRMYKLLPKTAEMAKVMEADDNADEGIVPTDDKVSAILEMEQPQEDKDADKAEREALLKKLVAVQQREPERFKATAVSLSMDPKMKLETIGLEGLRISDEEIEANRGEGA